MKYDERLVEAIGMALRIRVERRLVPNRITLKHGRALPIISDAMAAGRVSILSIYGTERTLDTVMRVDHGYRVLLSVEGGPCAYQDKIDKLATALGLVVLTGVPMPMSIRNFGESDTHFAAFQLGASYLIPTPALRNASDGGLKIKRTLDISPRMLNIRRGMLGQSNGVTP